jgi:uroporphyrin-III C-methyltransferase
VLIYDALVDGDLLSLVPDTCRKLDVGKRGGRPSTPQSEINRLLVKYCQQGRLVVRLKNGDPFVFGRAQAEIQALRAANCAYEVVPGLSSALVAPLLAGIPLTDPVLSRGFTVITAHNPDTLDWVALARMETLVMLMGGRSLPEIVRRLRGHGRSPYMPIAVIRYAGRQRQRVWEGTLGDILEKTADASLSPCVIVVGEVVRLRQYLSFESSVISGEWEASRRQRLTQQEATPELQASFAEPEPSSVEATPIARDPAPTASADLPTTTQVEDRSGLGRPQPMFSDPVSSDDNFASKPEDDLTSELDRSSSELDTSPSEVELLSSEVNTLSSEVDHSSSELDTSPSEVELLSSELDSSSPEVEHSSTELAPSSSELQWSSSEVEHFSSELEPSNLELDPSDSESDNWPTEANDSASVPDSLPAIAHPMPTESPSPHFPISSSLPLTHKTVLVTRATGQSGQFAALLTEAGATVIEMPTLEIGPPSSWDELDDAIAHLDDFDWLILTSTNAVDYFIQRLRKKRGDDVLVEIQIAVVGEKTADRLEQLGIRPDFIPPNFIADSLVANFPERLNGLKILFPRVESGGRDILIKEFTNQGATVRQVAAYESGCPTEVDPVAFAALRDRQIDIVTFASSKTVKHFCLLLYRAERNDAWKSWLENVCIASIGPQTSQACEALLGRVDVEPQEYTLDGLVQAIAEYIQRSP